MQAIELDLRGTADGAVVVLHDATVDRTTNGHGDVTGLTRREVQALDAGQHAGAAFAGERVPAYEEVLELVKGTGVTLLLDIKISPVLDKARVVRLVPMDVREWALCSLMFPILEGRGSSKGSASWPMVTPTSLRSR